ncbi:MAG: hypothetical protein ACI4LB_07965, partial [Candidatus Fimenecus sp.]
KNLVACKVYFLLLAILRFAQDDKLGFGVELTERSRPFPTHCHSAPSGEKSRFAHFIPCTIGDFSLRSE